VSRRIQIVLPDPAAELLRDHATAAGLAPSTLAAQFVRERLQHVEPAPRRAPIRHRAGGAVRPSWLEPYGASRAWRPETWGAIVALHGRYPRELGALKDGWWEDPAHLETLCALTVWRAQIDSYGQDPREELAFHAQLADYAQTLKAEGGGVERAWKPGAPPDEWG